MAAPITCCCRVYRCGARKTRQSDSWRNLRGTLSIRSAGKLASTAQAGMGIFLLFETQ